MTAITGDKCPIHHEIFCPVHADVQRDIREIKGRQDARHCESNEVRLNNAVDDIGELKGVDAEQWAAINQLRRLVYIGAGGVSVAAFFGSIVGQMIVAHFGKR
ncbi:MAG TPA: hypothetical protein DCY27_01860 [Desulfobacterales bacterium]|nr:hypothetical protein [Desulfobacterales bacterium]